jgi:hypothetical protein
MGHDHSVSFDCSTTSAVAFFYTSRFAICFPSAVHCFKTHPVSLILFIYSVYCAGFSAVLLMK